AWPRTDQGPTGVARGRCPFMRIRGDESGVRDTARSGRGCSSAGVAMSYAPTASNDENQQLDQNRSAPFRLSDTESIASGRLQVEGDGSLKDALAGIGANG